VEQAAMVRNVFRRRNAGTPRYYLYLSKTKVEMLYPQIPRRLVRSLGAEVTASIGVLQATVKGGKQPDSTDLYFQTAVVDRYLVRHDQVGTVGSPELYVKDVATLRYGIVSEYAADIAFFGGNVGDTKLGLIGSSDSMVGESQRVETRHAPFYYTLRFLGQTAAADASPATSPPYYTYPEAYDIALSATTSLEAKVEFLGRVLHLEPGLLIVTPIYVAFAG
jgi:hypothetical protein